MKKIILVICFLVTTLATFSQAKFYSNGKQVAELKCDMPDIKVTVPVPAEVANHDEIELCISYFYGDSSNVAKFSNCKTFKVDYLKAQKEVSVWIKSPKMKTGEFCIDGSNCFQIDLLCNDTYRNSKTGKILIRFYGKNITGYEWVNKQKMPKYKYSSPLTKDGIKMNFGDITQRVSTKENMLATSKFTGPKYMSYVTPDYQGDEIIKSGYSSLKEKDYQGNLEFKNPILFHAKVMDSKNDPSIKLSKEYLKHICLLSLIKKSNDYRYDNSGYLENPKIFYNNQYSEPIIKEYQLSGKKKLANIKAIASAMEKKIKEIEETAVWEKVKVGNAEVEMLKLSSYHRDDIVRDANDFCEIKPEAKANFYYYFVAEKNGKVIAGSFFREKPQEITTDEQAFIDYVLKTFEIN